VLFRGDAGAREGLAGFEEPLDGQREKIPEQGRAYQQLVDYYRNIREFRKVSEVYGTTIEKIRKAHIGDRETGKGFSTGAQYDLELL